ncbi:MAG: hypothetical protein CMP11_06590 [Zetaproteobacteria bacterium]|nr:hypothetical protein [Pseudobdellovibrionaceae bacterium]|tara:strand:+ start:314 stop:622 length:309 start_codon:yes stop_codon:yes gene_type:complete
MLGAFYSFLFFSTLFLFSLNFMDKILKGSLDDFSHPDCPQTIDSYLKEKKMKKCLAPEIDYQGKGRNPNIFPQAICWFIFKHKIDLQKLPFKSETGKRGLCL